MRPGETVIVYSQHQMLYAGAEVEAIILDDMPEGKYAMTLIEEGTFFDGVKHEWVEDRGDGRGEWVPA